MEDVIESTPTSAPEENAAVTTMPAEATATEPAEATPAEATSPAKADTAIDAETRRKILSEAEPDEILSQNQKLKRHLDGKAGQLADALAEKRLEKRLQDREIENLEKQEREARSTDAWKAAELRDQIDAKRSGMDAQERGVYSNPEDFQRSISLSLAQVQETLPETVRRKLQGKSYPGTYHEGLAAYIQDVVTETRAHEQQRWEKEELPAREKAIRARINGGEPSPELGGGYPAGVKVVTPADVAKMSLPEYETYFDDNGDPKKGVLFRQK